MCDHAPPTFLYHATCPDLLNRLLINGIWPSEQVPGRINEKWWTGLPVSTQRVYLADHASPFYSIKRQERDGKDEDEIEQAAILKIDTDKLDHGLIEPDDDALETATRFVPHHALVPELRCDADLRGATEIERTLWFRDRLSELRAHLSTSLSALGQCTYRGRVPADAIRSAALIDLYELGLTNAAINAGLGPTMDNLFTPAMQGKPPINSSIKPSLSEYNNRANDLDKLTQWIFSAGQDATCPLLDIPGGMRCAQRRDAVQIITEPVIYAP